MKPIFTLFLLFSLSFSYSQPSAEDLLNIVNYRIQDCESFTKIESICKDCFRKTIKQPSGMKVWYLNDQPTFFFTFINPKNVIMLKNFTTSGSGDMFKGYYDVLTKHCSSKNFKVVNTDNSTNFSEKSYEYIVSNRVYHIKLGKRKFDNGTVNYIVNIVLDKY